MSNNQEPEKMGFNPNKQTLQKLFKKENLSKRNTQVLEDFIQKMSARGTGKATLKDYASRFSRLTTIIDFDLDEANKQDIEGIVSALNSDSLRKKNGDAYSDYSKEHFWKAVRVFYNQFINVEGRGYNEALDGPRLVDDLDVNTNIEHNIDTDTRPSPTHIQSVAEKARSLRDRALMVFGWSTGARIGELAKTADIHQYPEPIKWRDIKFNKKEMEVTLKGKTGERTVPLRTGYGLMKQLQKEKNPDLSEPVFTQHNSKNHCPDCETRVSPKTRGTSYSNRTYVCKSDSCDWRGSPEDALKKQAAMSDGNMRSRLKDLLNKAKKSGEVPEQITHKPHWFWRDARALYWAAKDKNENFLRAFFGWSKNSDAPKHYISLMQESMLAGIREDFGEELSEDERRFNDNSLKPEKCQCGEYISNIQNYCPDCGQEISKNLEQHNKGQQATKEEELKDAINEVIEERGLIEDAKERLRSE